LEAASEEGPQSLQGARDEAEHRLLVESLTRNAGNITRAARDIKVSRPTFHDLLRKHGIEAGRYRNSDVPGQPESAEAADAGGNEPDGTGEERL
jgi:DNA-binding NtrC family response regulator